MKVVIMTVARGALLQEKIDFELGEQDPKLANSIEVCVRTMEGATLEALLRK